VTIKNFNVDHCFIDVIEAIDNGKEFITLDSPSKKMRLGAFKKEEFKILRFWVFDAYSLACSRGYNLNGEKFELPGELESLKFLSHREILYLSARCEKLIKHLSDLKSATEAVLLDNYFSNLESYPDANEILFGGLKPETYLMRENIYGITALLVFDQAITFGIKGDWGNFIQLLYRANRLMNDGFHVLTTLSADQWFANVAQKRAASGGEGRARKFKHLKDETIRLFLSQEWKSAPIAAQSITPQIVALSKNGRGDLLPSTTKPLEWIRAHKKMQKSNLS
jgi:hypothetical protein